MAVRYKMTELYLVCSWVWLENHRLFNAWDYHSKSPGVWGKPTPQMTFCLSLLDWERALKTCVSESKPFIRVDIIQASLWFLHWKVNWEHVLAQMLSCVFISCTEMHLFNFSPEHWALLAAWTLPPIVFGSWKYFGFFLVFTLLCWMPFKDHPVRALAGDAHMSSTQMVSQPTLILPSLIDGTADCLKLNRCIFRTQHLLFVRFVFLPSIT